MTTPPTGGWPLEIESSFGRWSITPGQTASIGRDPAAVISLAIPDVSRRHAEISYDGSGWVVRDLNSSNGLWVNGSRVPEVRITQPTWFQLGPAPQAPKFLARAVAPLPPQPHAAPPVAGWPQGQAAPGAPLPPPMRPGAPMGGPGLPPPGMPPRPGMPQGMPPQGMPPQGMPPQGMPPQGMMAPGPAPVAPQAFPMTPNTAPTQRMQPQAAPLHADIPEGTVLAYGQVRSAERREVGPGVITIGRAQDNTITIDDMLASRHHARLTPDGRGGFNVDDLGSANGTTINGTLVRQGHAGPGDVVTIGKRHFAVDRGALVEIEESTRVSFSADQISYVLPDGKQLLDTLQFDLAPSSLTAVVGPSGAGKSTLFRVLTGENQPHTGAVFYNGRSLHDNYADVRQRLGVVPQDDVIHRQLTVERALQYAAELRFPDDLDKSDRDRRVAETMQELGLVQHAKTQVSRLSGGQRKRVSVAMELLTQPSLLFLDEPTSGLDPGLDKQVMQLLRELADGDRTVMVITHSVANLGYCDNVLLLAPGGKQAYFGPPDGLLPYFGMADYADVFEAVTSNPDYARDQFRATHPLRPTGAALQQQQQQPQQPQQPTPPPKKKGFFRQVSTLTRRQVRVMLADRTYVAFTFLTPILLGLLTLLVPGVDAFGAWPPPQEIVKNQGDHSSQEALILLVILVVGAVFSGMAASTSLLVTERPIYKREQSVGLRASSYLASKLIVLAVVTAVQCGLMLFISALRRKPADVTLLFPNPWIEMFFLLALTAFTCAVLGLVLSSLVTTNDQVMPLLVVFVMAQLVFTGGLFRVDKAVIEQFSWLFPSRWGYGAISASIDVQKVAPSAQATGDELWKHTAGNFWLCVSILVLQMVIFGAVAFWRVSRKQK